MFVSRPQPRGSKIVVIALLMGGTLAGCADQSLALQGAALGAVGCGLIGYLAGGARGGLIGAGACGVGGAAIGAILGSQQQKFASAEEELRVRTAEARHAAEQQRTLASQYEATARNYERSLAPLRHQVAAGRAMNGSQQAARDDAVRDRAQMDATIKSSQKAIQVLQDQVADLKQKLQNTAALEGQLRNLEQSTNRMKLALVRMNRNLADIEA